MARPKKTETKTTGARNATAKRTPKGRTAVIKMLKGTASTKRPPNNPEVPQLTIEQLNEELNDVNEVLDDFAQHLRSLDRCPKAYGFWARSLRYAQTPHINSWSFAKGKTPKLSGVAG